MNEVVTKRDFRRLVSDDRISRSMHFLVEKYPLKVSTFYTIQLACIGVKLYERQCVLVVGCSFFESPEKTFLHSREAIVWKHCRIWILIRVYAVDQVAFMSICTRQNRTAVKTLPTLERQCFTYCCIVSRRNHVTWVPKVLDGFDEVAKFPEVFLRLIPKA